MLATSFGPVTHYSTILKYSDPKKHFCILKKIEVIALDINLKWLLQTNDSAFVLANFT